MNDLNLGIDSLPVIEISVSTRAIKALEFHCSRLQCVVPNTMNFFNEVFIERIQSVLKSANSVCSVGHFEITDEDAFKLENDVVALRDSVLSCSASLRATFYESFDFVFNFLIRLLNKRRFITDNFVMDLSDEENILFKEFEKKVLT